MEACHLQDPGDVEARRVPALGPIAIPDGDPRPASVSKVSPDSKSPMSYSQPACRSLQSLSGNGRWFTSVPRTRPRASRTSVPEAAGVVALAVQAASNNRLDTAAIGTPTSVARPPSYR
jgi:hypothetical protein